MDTDRDLIHVFLSARDDRRDAAFRALVERHGPMVASACRRIAGGDSDDAFQAVFIILARRAADLADHPSLGGWLHRTAVHVALRTRSRQDARRRHEEVAAMIRLETGVDESVQRSELRAELDAALDRLSDRYRVPLILHYLEGRSQADVADALAMSVGTLTSRLSRAREKLRSTLRPRDAAIPALLLAAFLDSDVGASEGALPVATLDQLFGVISERVPASPAVTALADSHLSAPRPLALRTTMAGASACVILLAAFVWSAFSRSTGAAGTTATAAASIAEASDRTDSIPAMAESDRRVYATFPPAVRAALSRLPGRAGLRECETSLSHGMRIYSVDILGPDGVEREVSVDEDGRIIESTTTEESDQERNRPAKPDEHPRSDASF